MGLSLNKRLVAGLFLRFPATLGVGLAFAEPTAAYQPTDFEKIPALKRYLRSIKKSPMVAYESSSFAAGITGRATGWFHTEKIGGREWAIDPVGRGYVFFGVQSANYRGVYSEFTKRAMYEEWNKAHGGYKAWIKRTLDRLQSWGFNTLSHGCDGRLQQRGMCRAHELHMGQRLCEEGVPKEFSIFHSGGRDACSSLPDMFHPDFPAWCKLYCKYRVAPYKDDPYTVGWFIDNELKWWWNGERDTWLYDLVMEMPADKPVRKALDAFMAGRKPTPELKEAFLLHAARKYFKVTSEAIRAADPNHMILGCRFAGVNGAGRVVWQAAGEYCDIVTFNIYPWCDLKCGVVRTQRVSPDDGKPDYTLMRQSVEERYRWAKKPLMITEWCFRALDTGHPNSAGAGQIFRTQVQRARAADMFLAEIGSIPSIVGHNFFRWVDQPPEGIRPKNREDGNYGLVNQRDEPYELLTEVFRRHQSNPRAFCSSKGVSQVCNTDKMKGAGDLDLIGLVDEVPSANVHAGTYDLADGGNLKAEGRIGGKMLLERITLAGREMGGINLTISTVDRHKNRNWYAVNEVVSAMVQKKESKMAGLKVMARGGSKEDGTAFSVSLILFVEAGRARVGMDVLNVTNESAKPFRLRGVYLGQFPSFMPLKKNASKARTLHRNVWKGYESDYWVAEDGCWEAVVSCSAMAEFNYNITASGHIHPDAAFFFGTPIDLAPSAGHDFESSADAMFFYGLGGEKEWFAVRRRLTECSR